MRPEGVEHQLILIGRKLAMSSEFVTARLRIRPWRAEDRPMLARMVHDPDMMRYITLGRTWSDEEIDELLERQARHLGKHGVCFGAVELAGAGEVIGLVGLQPHDDGQFELGWWIWKEHWGRGYATEAAWAFVAHAREVMGLDRLVAVIDPPNAASVRVAEHLGMRFECLKSARDTIAKRPDVPIAYYGMSLREPRGKQV
jgi:[ribosomal protein S5]-alanine N-acetyltransferase